ncbi:MAG: penicillin-binding protein 1C [Raineya sp.]
MVLDADDKVLGAFLSQDDKWRMKTELSEISEELQEAFIQKEDKYFFYHFGFNPVSLLRAIFQNVWQQKRASGASTITMQVARLLEPKKRTYWNKIIEIFRALQLEVHYSKKEILQMYLNLVPYGGNIEGVKSASVLYFNKFPQNLSIAQIATLAIIPNRPSSLQLGKDTPKLTQERNKWLRRFAQEKVFDKHEIQNALTEPCQVSRQTLAQFAPHFSQRLSKMYPEKVNIKSNIKITLQTKANDLAKNYSKRLKSLQIENVAILIVANKTRKVLAYVGSQDFAESQVDGVTAIRSPGSTLKPLVYALAMDLGKITPKSTINDIPTDWQGYAPDNFDKQFRGKISIEEALSQSLNIPAVGVLNQITVPFFVKKLSQIGFQTIRKQGKKLGLSMVLGGCGVSLEELTALYATFANLGLYAELSYLAEERNTITDTLLSETSAYSIAQVLTLPQRPDLPKAYQVAQNKPLIAWKTGTSYGRRDAWSIGFNQDYTIGVWVGNFNGRGVPELTGSEVASPLLFELFGVVGNPSGALLPIPQKLDFRLVCTETGLPPNDFCKNQVTDYYIPLLSPTQTCQHLKEVYISADEKHSYLPDCLPPNGYKKKLFHNLSPDLKAYYEAEKIPFEQMPPYAPECENQIVSNQQLRPQIVSPIDGKIYIIPEKSQPELLLKAYLHNDVKKVFWYVDDRLYQEAKPNEKVFWKPILGKTKISCTDDKGRSSQISISVEWE